MNGTGPHVRLLFLPLRRGLTLVAAAFLVSGCATRGNQAAAPAAEIQQPQPPQRGWRGIMHLPDQERIRQVDANWAQALGEARRGGFTRRLTAEGALLQPDAALPRAAPPPGSYRCRSMRIGPGSRRQRALAARGPFFCHVGAEGPLLSLTQQTGTQRPGGYLWEESDIRMIFIGAVATGREQVPPAYGDDPERNVVGIVERVGQFRWRLIIPNPAAGATLDVMELVPALS